MTEDLNTAISSAVQSATKEVSGEPEAPTPTPTEEPAKDEPKVEAEEPSKDEPSEEEFWNPTAEELAAIDKNPELKKVYRSMQRGLTQKTQKLAEFRKEVEERVKIADWIQSEPEKAIRALAAATGLTLAQAEKKLEEAKVVDDLEKEWGDTVGPEAAKLLRPLFEKTAEALIAKTVAPYREQTEALARAAAERGIAASLREFGASVVERGEEWDEELQGEMAQITQSITPADDATIEDYLATVYDVAIARRSRARTARENLARLKRVKGEAEPTTTSRPAPKGEERVTVDMSDKDAIALAVKQAREQVQSRR
jgi:hypothetical protein